MLRGQHVGEFSDGEGVQTLGFYLTSLAKLACDSWSNVEAFAEVLF